MSVTLRSCLAPTALFLAACVHAAPAAACTMTVPFQYEFENQVRTSLSAANASDPCAFTVSVNTGAGPSAAGVVHYRRGRPLTLLRYGFRLDTSGLSGFALATRQLQLFSALSPVVVNAGSPTSALLTLTLRGGFPDPNVAFFAARSGNNGPAIAVRSLPLGVHTIRLEITTGAGSAGVVRYWIDHTYGDPPDGTIDNSGTGLDNAAWLGVIAAEIGLSNPSNAFRTNNADNMLVFDQFESSDDVLFYDDFSSGAQ